MTAAEAAARLAELPEPMRTRRWIESEIRRETAQAIATRHDCECGRGACRATMCSACWRELLPYAAEGES